MGWMTKKGSRYYRISETVGHKINAAGNEIPIKKEFYGKTKKEAEAKRDAFMLQQQNGIESNSQLFGIMADGWIEEFFMHDSNKKDTTKATYLRYWNKHVRPSELYTTPLNEVTAKTIQSLYNRLFKQGCPTSGIRKINNLMLPFFKYLASEGFSRDVTNALTVPEEKQQEAAEDRPEVWTDEELDIIFSNFDKAHENFRLRFLLVLARHTGCRIGELLAVTYDDFTEQGLRINKQLSETILEVKDKVVVKPDITLPKSKKAVRTVPLNDAVKKELRIHKGWHLQEQMKNGYRTEYVFTTNSGGLYDKKNLRRACDRYYKTIGVPCRDFHVYRHTFGSNLCKKGVPIQIASELLGHENINTTAKYYVNVSAEEKQAAVDKLVL